MMFLLIALVVGLVFGALVEWRVGRLAQSRGPAGAASDRTTL
jgi:hypothetical protein